VPPWRDGGQAQFIEQPMPRLPALSTSATRQWALDNLRLPLTLADLAAHAQSHDEAGQSPAATRYRSLLEKIRRKNRNTFSTSRKIEAASSGAEVMSLERRSRWKSTIVKPAKMTRPRIE